MFEPVPHHIAVQYAAYLASLKPARLSPIRPNTRWNAPNRLPVASEPPGFADRTRHELSYLWTHMIQRCGNPEHPSYRWYGARGIKVCERWLVLDNFLADVLPRPIDCHLHRIDNDGDYCPENCRWVSADYNIQEALDRRLPMMMQF